LPVGWFNLRGHLANAIHSESRGGTASRAAQRLRYAFIVAQIALAFVLLTGAGLLGVSLHQVLETSPGFQTEHVLTGQLTLPAKKYPDGKTQLPLVRRLIAAIQAQPGVRSVAVGDLMPFGTENSSGSTTVEGVETKDGLRNVHYRNGIDGQYWQTMGIPLIEGRLLEDADNDRKQLVCVVDQAFARRYWPGESALGHRLSDGPLFQKDQAFTIIGVVGSVKQNELDDVKPLGTIYYPYRYWWGLEISVLAKTAVATESIAPALRKAVLEIDPDLPIEKLEPMRNLIDDSLVNRRSPAVLAGIFAVVALLLTAMGTYGVLAYAIRQRRREIGLRMALGARPQQVLRQFLGLGTKMLAAGMAVGMAGAWAVSRSMQSVLFGIGSVQLNIFSVTAGVMISVVLSAILLPSLWASRVSPTEALRD
jgi:predicted permease